MDLQLKGKLAVVSGSTKGIGLAIGKCLVREGAAVIVNGRSTDSVGEALAEIQREAPGADVVGFVGDLSSPNEVSRLVKKYPNVDIVINNLGIFESMPFNDIDDEDWDRFFQVNIMSGVRLSRAYLPVMHERNWGRIIFISSESGIAIPPDMVHYGVTKTAQLAVSRGLAEVCTGTGITVNSVLPGPTRSAGLEEFAKSVRGNDSFEVFEGNFFRHVRPTSIIKRFASTYEVATLVTYLASPLASATTGAALRVDGGVVKSCF